MFEAGRKIKILLAEKGLTQVWLIDALREHEIYTDKAEMSGILSGARRGPKADTILGMSLNILNGVYVGHQ